MTWKIRHEGSPRSVEGLSLSQVVEGLQEGQWEPTDEVMGPTERQWTSLENHPQLAEVTADLEPPQPKSHDDETRLDMNPLIDVCLVLLIFFILSANYSALLRVLDMPAASKQKTPSIAKISPRTVADKMIRVDISMENGKPVFRVEGKVTEESNLEAALKQFAKQKNEVLLVSAKGAEWGAVVTVQDAAAGTGIERIGWAKETK